MSQLSVKRFVEVLQGSKLIPRDKLRDSLLQCKRTNGDRLPDDPEAVAQYLIDAELLTRWQSKKLLSGKYKGFYLGHYKLLDHIGTGGMSSVYLAEHTLMNKLRAIKVLPKNLIGESSYLARFQREAKATATLDHPNIVRAFDLDQKDDNYYLVMEFVEGQNLESIVQQTTVGFETTADYIAQAARGLHHAHEAGLIHRDVKPANLLINTEGVVKILDLGLALVLGSEASVTLLHNENVLGTADYLAPEQAVNSHEVDRRADVYGLGCTLYFALTGHAPFVQGSVAQRIVDHQTKMPPGIAIDRPDCPTEVAGICTKMLQKNPAKRYQTCLDVARALEQWLQLRRDLAEKSTQDLSARRKT